MKKQILYILAGAIIAGAATSCSKEKDISYDVIKYTTPTSDKVVVEKEETNNYIYIAPQEMDLNVETYTSLLFELITGQNVTFKSDNEDVVTIKIDEDGDPIIYGKAEGSANIIASIDGKKDVIIKVFVSDGFFIDGDKAEIQKVEFVSDYNEYTITYTVNNEEDSFYIGTDEIGVYISTENGGDADVIYANYSSENGIFTAKLDFELHGITFRGNIKYTLE